jgi:hypothetical protein
VQPEEVQPGRLGDATPLYRPATLIEYRNVDPAEVVRVAGRPDDRVDVLPGEVERVDLIEGDGKSGRVRGIFCSELFRDSPAADMKLR